MRWPWRRPRPRSIRAPGLTTAPAAVGRASYPKGPGRLWAADLAMAATGAGPLYLAVVVDCYSRHCLGWSTGKGLEPELVLRAVEAARASSRPALGSRADRDGIALALSASCRGAGIEVPPGSSPTGIDGAVARSFFSLLVHELGESAAWRTRTDAAEAIGSWIEGTYNRALVGPPIPEALPA